MGFLGSILGVLFGGGRNVITQTIGAFRPNAEKSAERNANYQSSALSEFGQEFRPGQGWFNNLIDGLNRLPRPAMALGVIALFVSAMWNPIWFAGRMQGLVLVPDQLWYLLGAIVTFYFGARYQVKAINAQRILRQTPQVVKNIASLRELNASSPGVAAGGSTDPTRNQAVEDFKAASKD